MANDGDKSNELDDLWRELTEPRSLEGSMSDMLPSKDTSADARDGKALLGKLVLSRFRIDKFLDGGSVGRIYSGTQLGLGRPVAIKVLRRQEGPRGELARKRFVREAEFLASMSHPNVVEMIAFGETEDGHVVMVMEKLEGHNLKDHLEQGGPMPVMRVLHIARQLAEAVGRAHDLGGVHRDLKPANVFIERDARDRDLVKVLDFGLVKPASAQTKNKASLTLSGFVLGTPFYMSPEQAMGDTLDARADVYSFGIMLYEMLTGVPPFRGDNVAEILTKHLEASPPPLIVNNPRVQAPMQLEHLIRSCLAKNPGDRPESMYAVIHELDAIERAQRRVEADVAAGLAGWDPERASGDFHVAIREPHSPEMWREPSVTGAEPWADQSQPPLVQPVSDDAQVERMFTGGSSASQPPPATDWNERSNNPWRETSAAAGDWSEHSLTPFPQGALPPSPAGPLAFGARTTPLALPANVPPPQQVDLWNHAPSESNPGLEDSSSRALVPIEQGGQLLPPPSISSAPQELQIAGQPAPGRKPGRSLLLLLAGLVMIALAWGLVHWAETSFNDNAPPPSRPGPRADLSQGHMDRAPTDSADIPKA